MNSLQIVTEYYYEQQPVHVHELWHEGRTAMHHDPCLAHPHLPLPLPETRPQLRLHPARIGHRHNLIHSPHLQLAS